jgi:hypothetical protein
MTTSTDINVMTQDFFQSLPEIVAEGMRLGARMLWYNGLMPIITKHWFTIMLIILGFFVVTTIKAMFGRWGSLGSFLYHFFYFGILFIIGLIWGPEIFVEDVFNTAVAVILYPTCYRLSGYVMDRMGVRKRRRF